MDDTKIFRAKKEVNKVKVFSFIATILHNNVDLLLTSKDSLGLSVFHFPSGSCLSRDELPLCVWG